MLNYEFLEKRLRLVSPSHLRHDFSRKISHVIFYKQTKFHYLNAFTCWDTG